MRVLSLYDGMACGMLAMLDAGVEVESYDAYEIDKYAVKNATHNFPMIQEHGDVFDADFTQYEGVDWLIGGSPCTYWSIAQTKNRETEASGLGWELFSQYVRALHEAKPKFFIYENNKSMSKAIRDSIREAFGFEEICINSALVSAQNRQRYYWVGKRNADGTYSKVDVKQPEDRGILLKDVLDGMAFTDHSRCVTAAVGRTTTRECFVKNQNTMAAEPICSTQDSKSFAITATEWKGSSPQHTLEKHIRTQIAEPLPFRQTTDGKAFCLDASYTKTPGSPATFLEGGHARANRSMVAEPAKTWWDEHGIPTKATSGADGKAYTVYPVRDGQITIKEKTYPVKLVDGYYIIRKLTVSECKRLQTVPDWYEFCVSPTQAYKMLGNGWTIQVISHLIKACLAECTADPLAQLRELIGGM